MHSKAFFRFLLSKQLYNTTLPKDMLDSNMWIRLELVNVILQIRHFGLRSEPEPSQWWSWNMFCHNNNNGKERIHHAGGNPCISI